jgi:Cu-Zn family superoxide dismutase
MKGIAIFSKYGHVQFIQKNDYCEISFSLQNFEPNSTHAIHIHEFGDLSNGCISLGGHFNPTIKNHGHLLSKDRHLGDLCNNFTTDELGCFQDIMHEPGFHVKDIIGRSVVIHEYWDDLGIGKYIDEPYRELPDKMLKKLCKERNYKGLRTKLDRIEKLENESLITGNAGSRMDCAIIGRMK